MRRLGALVRKYGPTLATTPSTTSRPAATDCSSWTTTPTGSSSCGAEAQEYGAEEPTWLTHGGASGTAPGPGQRGAVGTDLTVEISETDDYTQSGRDQVTILLQPHPGAEPRRPPVASCPG